MLNKDVCPREEAHLTGKPQQKVTGVKDSNRPNEIEETGLPDDHLKTDKIEQVEVVPADESKSKAKKITKPKVARLPNADVARLPHDDKSKRKNGQDEVPFLTVVDREPRRRFGRRNEDQVTMVFLRLFLKA